MVKKFNIVPEEAEVIRLIYDNFLKNTQLNIQKSNLKRWELNLIQSGHFSNTSTRFFILRQEKYTGNSLLQKLILKTISLKKTKIKPWENFPCIMLRIPILLLLKRKYLIRFKLRLPKYCELGSLMPTSKL